MGGGGGGGGGGGQLLTCCMQALNIDQCQELMLLMSYMTIDTRGSRGKANYLCQLIGRISLNLQTMLSVGRMTTLKFGFNSGKSQRTTFKHILA